METREQKVTGNPVLSRVMQPCDTGLVYAQEESPVTWDRKVEGQGQHVWDRAEHHIALGSQPAR